jgi:energy-coupling factor transporter ATP-binding protein EcfA2
MPRLIIVEGPDGSGKTTLCRYIAGVTKREYYHTGGPPSTKQGMEENLATLRNKHRTHPQGLVVDRHPAISDPIYAEVNNRVLLLSKDRLEHAMDELDPIVVFCRIASIREMFMSIDKTNKPHKPVTHLAEVLENYKQVVTMYDKAYSATLARLGPARVWKYDRMIQDPRAITERIGLCAA